MNNSYIKGFFDGEGHIPKDTRRYKTLLITNTDRELLLEMSNHLKELGIENKIKIHNKNDKNPKHNRCYRLHISGYRNIICYGKKIGFHSKKNKEKYKQMIMFYNLNIKKYPNCNLLKR